LKKRSVGSTQFVNELKTERKSMSKSPKYGYAHDSSQGGEGGPLHTLDDYIRAQVLLEMDEAGIPANQPYNEDEFSALIQRLKEDLDDIVNLVSDPSRNTYIKVYCLGYDLEKLRL
jgi:hypothetical protein